MMWSAIPGDSLFHNKIIGWSTRFASVPAFSPDDNLPHSGIFKNCKPSTSSNSWIILVIDGSGPFQMGSLIVALATDWAVLALVQNMVTWSMCVDIKYYINSFGMAVMRKCLLSVSSTSSCSITLLVNETLGTECKGGINSTSCLVVNSSFHPISCV